MNIENANRLIKLRKKMGYSQESLASKLGISRQSVSSGKGRNHLQTRTI
ncbi:MAG: helix-turn-helix domain-containing protein [Bacilli bacterium]